MKQKQTAFTLIELMLGLFLAVLLGSLLVTILMAFKESYQRIITTATLLDDSRFAVAILRRHIHAAQSIYAIIPYSQLSALWKQRLGSRSDVLLLNEHSHEVAYYLSLASWKLNNKPIISLFMKPIGGRRQELVSNVVALHFTHKLNGVAYDITLKSLFPVLRLVKKFEDRYLYRTWHGFALVGTTDAATS